MNNQTDLQKFVRLFQEDKYKIFTGKIEYRVSNLDTGIAEAKRLISVHKLKLAVRSSGQLATYKAFEVHESADQEAAAA
ncbi:hypothetical protein KHS38_11915 [Mucilaginibacter sp. Bleaf8]|uniref:hypothetical protein n=1 Tax=Mucilaginibacter sp. Bleaf8 TaxID=2834430 RepID=UPI001BD14FA1|nr:hypothetical protein [Mucilaginibacter sp. Bleaf8]MBS7565112.1 hypothetical protein [Mucilaginibacter sp. Bleaf8]